MKKNRRRAKYENYYDELRKLGILKPETKDNEEDKEKDYSNLTESQMRKILEEKGIGTTTAMKKAELINLLTESEKIVVVTGEGITFNIDPIEENNTEEDTTMAVNEEETIEDIEIEEE